MGWGLAHAEYGGTAAAPGLCAAGEGGWRVKRRASRVCSRQAGGKAGKDSGKTKTKAVSRSQRAGLQVSRGNSG